MNAKHGIMPMRPVLILLCALTAAAAVFILWPRAQALTVRPIPEAERDSYTLTLIMREETGTVSVRERIETVNRTGKTTDHLVLRFYLNAFRTEETSPMMTEELYAYCYPEGFSPGEALQMGVFLGETALACTWLDEAETVLSVPVSLLPDESCVLEVNTVLVLPRMRGRTGRSENIWTLGNAIPILAPYDPERGDWRMDEYGPIGDPFVSECADWDVRITVSGDWKALGSAPFEREKDGTYHASGKALRDFLVVFYRGAVSRRAVFGDVTVETLVPEGKDILSLCARMLANDARFFGACPYPYLCVIALDFSFSGMEYPGAVLLSESLFSQDDGWELTLAHEIAHQWFYALVLSDQVNHPWQDEAVCEYAVILWGRETYGTSSEELLRYRLAMAPMQESGFQVTPGAPIGLFPDYDAYHTLVYGQGCAYLCALDTFLEGRLCDFLRFYCDTFAYGLADREDFENLLCDFAGTDLSVLTADYLDTLR